MASISNWELNWTRNFKLINSILKKFIFSDDGGGGEKWDT